MSLHHECIRCAGTGQEMALGTGTWGETYAGVCSYCHGKGLLLDLPVSAGTYSFRAPDGRRFASEAEYREVLEYEEAIEREQQAAEADRAEWRDVHEHHFN